MYMNNILNTNTDRFLCRVVKLIILMVNARQQDHRSAPLLSKANFISHRVGLGFYSIILNLIPVLNLKPL